MWISDFRLNYVVAMKREKKINTICDLDFIKRIRCVFKSKMKRRMLNSSNASHVAASDQFLWPSFPILYTVFNRDDQLKQYTQSNERIQILVDTRRATFTDIFKESRNAKNADKTKSE